MALLFGREAGPRWPRKQKFRLSVIGTEAEADYQAVVTWAAPLGVQPGDGVYLSELRISIQTLTELVECLDSCGTTKSEASAALDRLLSAKLAELVAF